MPSAAIEIKPRESSKYHNLFLFEWCAEELKKCMSRLDEQTRIYQSQDRHLRRKMRIRGLFVAALTLNATAIWTAKLIMRGGFVMSSQILFFKKRWRMKATEWGENPKSCFARALCGYSTGADGVCIDRHLERMELAPKDAAAQWKEWFRLYQSMYGPGETVLCIRWHIELLDWIALRGHKPIPWK